MMFLLYYSFVGLDGTPKHHQQIINKSPTNHQQLINKAQRKHQIHKQKSSNHFGVACWTLGQWEANVEARVRALRPLASSCSERELSILACAVEQLQVVRGVDAMKELLVIQVETRHHYYSKVRCCRLMVGTNMWFGSTTLKG